MSISIRYVTILILGLLLGHELMCSLEAKEQSPLDSDVGALSAQRLRDDEQVGTVVRPNRAAGWRKSGGSGTSPGRLEVTQEAKAESLFGPDYGGDIIFWWQATFDWTVKIAADEKEVLPVIDCTYRIFRESHDGSRRPVTPQGSETPGRPGHAFWHVADNDHRDFEVMVYADSLSKKLWLMGMNNVRMSTDLRRMIDSLPRSAGVEEPMDYHLDLHLMPLRTTDQGRNDLSESVPRITPNAMEKLLTDYSRDRPHLVQDHELFGYLKYNVSVWRHEPGKACAQIKVVYEVKADGTVIWRRSGINERWGIYIQEQSDALHDMIFSQPIVRWVDSAGVR